MAPATIFVIDQGRPTMTSRRQFVVQLVPATLALGAAAQAMAEPAKVDENDAAAKAVGYRNDATKVDAAKYPTYAKGKVCGGCQLFQGKPGDAWGACPIVGMKLVNAKGWCTAWVKKA
jgi:hypothetical protein